MQPTYLFANLNMKKVLLVLKKFVRICVKALTEMQYIGMEDKKIGFLLY
jgi:hypothetical protein